MPADRQYCKNKHKWRII